MLTTLIAVAGTLAGAVVSGLLQQRGARADRAEARAEQRRSERMDAVTALAVALSDHRRAMWTVRSAVLAGEPADRVQELRDESHRTRSAVTDPAVRLRLLVSDPTVREAAETAIARTYGMRSAVDTGALQTCRESALEAHDTFVNTAGAFLTSA